MCENLIADDTLGASSRIDIDSRRLMVSSGIGSFFGAILGYGYDAGGNDGDMHEDFEGYNENPRALPLGAQRNKWRLSL